MGVCSLEDVLFPKIDVRLEQVEFASDALVVKAAACGPAPRCPGCRARARRVHSSYERGLAERPVTGTQLRVRLRVRRFFCDRSSCRRKTLVEQVSGLSERYRRSSIGTKQFLRAVAVELGGRAGERLCRRLCLAAGDRPTAQPGPQDRASLPRHRSGRASLIRPRTSARGRAGTVQAIPERTLH